MFSILGFNSNKEIYKTAFIHKSLKVKEDNERLEFLGDAVLSLIVSEFLYSHNKQKNEGFLSQKRADIVARKHLNLVGEKLIPKELIKTNLNNTPLNLYGNTLEAIIGALYLDKGIKPVREFIKKNIYNSEFLKDFENKDFKSKLLVFSQKKKVKVFYEVEKLEGPDHKKEFSVAVFIDNKKISTAKAYSKKEAEQKAAKKAIKIVF
mgnify:CR=1 FL=1